VESQLRMITFREEVTGLSSDFVNFVTGGGGGRIKIIQQTGFPTLKSVTRIYNGGAAGAPKPSNSLRSLFLTSPFRLHFRTSRSRRIRQQYY
jgi:hypothetical protein